MMPRKEHEIAASLRSSQRRLDCGNPRCGFARIRCPDCQAEHLLMFSGRTRGFCPSCHSKRLEEWGEWMRETLLLDVPHRQVVFTIPKILRIFFRYNRRLLGDLCRAAVLALLKYLQATTGSELIPGVVAVIESFGQKMNFHPHVHLLVSEGGEDGEGTFHLERLFFDDKEGRVGYRYGKDPKELEPMDYLEFIARVTSHIRDKGQVTIRYFGLC